MINIGSIGPRRRRMVVAVLRDSVYVHVATCVHTVIQSCLIVFKNQFYWYNESRRHTSENNIS